MSRLEVLISFFGLLGSLIGYISIREKRSMRGELAAQTELAKVRAEYLVRIQELERKVEGLEDYNRQLRNIMEEERALCDRVRAELETVMYANELMKKQLVNAGLARFSDFPNVQKKTEK